MEGSLLLIHKDTHTQTCLVAYTTNPAPLASGLLASIYLCVNPLLLHTLPLPSSLLSCMLSPLLLPCLLSNPAGYSLIHAACYMISWNTTHTTQWLLGLFTLCRAESTEGYQRHAEPTSSDLSFPFPSCDCMLLICPAPPHPPSPD